MPAEEGSPPVDAAGFRRAMARWPTGVAVLTTHDEGVDSGLTVNAFLSVTLAPPRVLVSLGHEAESTPRVERAGRFAVHFLAASQRAVSERFALAIPTEEKFAGLSTRPGLGGVPILLGCLAVLECVVRSALDVGDHRLFVGEVLRQHLGEEGAPLLFYQSQYVTPDPAGRITLPNARP